MGSSKLPTADRDSLADLKQITNVQSLISKLSDLLLRMPLVSEDEAKDRFRRALKSTIRARVDSQSLQWPSLQTLQAEALKQESVLTQTTIKQAFPSYNTDTRHTPTRRDNNNNTNSMEVDIAALQRPPFIKLTPAERAFLYRNKACFRCRQLNANHTATSCTNPPQTNQAIQQIEQDTNTTLNPRSNPVEPEVLEMELSNGRYANQANLALQTKAGSEANRQEINISPSITNFIPRDPGDWMLNRTISQQIFEQWGQPKIDLFASRHNKQAEFYYRKPSATSKAGTGCLGNDALAAKWFGHELLYANPPWELTEQVIKKARADKVERMIVISPNCTHQLREMSIAKPIRLMHTHDLFIPPSQQNRDERGVGLPRWKRTYAFLISGTQTRKKSVPVETTRDSRFIFNATLNTLKATILVDTGCTTNVVSSDFYRKHGLRTQNAPTMQLRFGNGQVTNANQSIQFTLNRRTYSKMVTFIVAPIKQDAIIGTPWFETITIQQLHWHSRTIRFYDSDTQETHDWSKLIRAPIDKVIHCTINELERDITWIVAVPLNKISDITDCAQLEHRGAYNFRVPDPASETIAAGKTTLPTSTIEPLLTEYANIFEEPTELPPSRPENHRILLEPDAPWRPIGQLSQYELNILKTTLQDMMNKGFIRHPSSPFGANILFAKKSDGGLRLCIDYRRLNSITVKDRTPLPNIKEMQNQLGAARYFTKLDLRDGFYNILIHPDDQHRTAFRTRYGHFEFQVMPFGLCNAPATFMRMMNRIFGKLYDTCIIAYVDDILIYSKTEQEHLEHLNQVFRLIRENKLFLKRSKCQFGQDSVDFCGTRVSREGIHLAQNKLASLFDTPPPTNIKQLQSFLGICNWFRDFIPEFSLIATPLTELTKKDQPWTWTPAQQNAMLLLLHRIATAPCLRYFDPNLTTYLYTDASLFGLGGWVGQQHPDGIHPIMFWSRKLLPAEVN